ncbi:hypothetical protein FB451DRAFT_1394611 [Mycena latifolia]|nr:hypothetical protein FB451DRAFT_1394611 [Mycena latifolia]
MFNFLQVRVVALVTAIGSVASAAIVVTILEYAGKALNIDLDAGGKNYAPVNSYSATTKTMMCISSHPPATTHSNGGLGFTVDYGPGECRRIPIQDPKYLSYASFNASGTGIHSQLVLRQNATAAVFSKQVVGPGATVNLVVPATGKVITSWSTPGSIAADPATHLNQESSGVSREHIYRYTLSREFEIWKATP